MSKLHHIRYITVDESEDSKDELLAASTEDGRIIFCSTRETRKPEADDPEPSIPYTQVRAQLGGRPCGLSGRVKDFDILLLDESQSRLWKNDYLVVTCSSDGAVRIWLLTRKELQLAAKKQQDGDSKKQKQEEKGTTTASVQQVGKLLGTYETGNRITCLKAFVMQPPETDEDGFGESEFESFGDDDDESGSEESDEE